MAIKNIYDSVTRKEKLEEPATLKSKDGKRKQQYWTGDIIESVYSYDLTLHGRERDSYQEAEIMMAENVIKAIFIKYGDKCLDEKFLNEKLKRELPSMGFSVSNINVTRFYKAIRTTMRGGWLELQSDAFFLHKKPEQALENN